MENSNVNRRKFLIAGALAMSACTNKENTTMQTNKNALVIEEQGSFAVGGSVKSSPGEYDAIKRTR